MASTEIPPVAAIVSVGAGAVVGDVVVAAVVLTDACMRKIAVRSDPHGSAFRIHLSHAQKSVPVIDFVVHYDGRYSRFAYDVGAPISHSGLMGNFGAFTDLVEFAAIGGFCPRSKDDLSIRTVSVCSNMTSLIFDKYPNSRIHTVPLLYIDAKGDFAALWSDRCSEYSPISNVEWSTRTDCSEVAKFRVFAAIRIATELAHGVRMSRISDQSLLYPSLDLETNLGYGCKQLYGGLRRLMAVDSGVVSEKAMRGDLALDWMAWAEANLFQSGAAAKVDVDRKSDAVAKDSQGRSIMPFDKPTAESMIKDILGNPARLTRLRSKAVAFVKSIDSQLTNRGSLSPRQMYVLAQIHSGRMNW